MLDREAFRVAVQHYLDAKGKNWTEFSRELGFSREHVSKVFHGRVSLPEGFVYRVIEVLAAWKGIQTRDQARALLKLMDAPDFPAENWGAEPLSTLREPIYDGKNVSSFGQNQGIHPQHSPGVNLWTVPYPRNPYFTGRDALLEHLDQQFTTARQLAPLYTHKVALTQPQAIKGLGGIGKTQIALEYAYRSRERGQYTHIIWVNAASEEAVLADFVQLAELLPTGRAKGEADQREVVEAMKYWFEQCREPWLLIFDNADDIALVRAYLPKQGIGSIVLTTRAHAVGSVATSIEVETMGWLEGTQLLLRRAGREDRASEEEINQAGNIAVALDHFPLALDQAGAYLEETQCSFVDYLTLYQTHRQALLASRGTLSTDYPHSVATTWWLSFQKVEQKSPAAAELLHLCAFLGADHIPEELLIDGAAYWPASLRQAATDRFAFQQAIADLLKFSLIKRQVEDRVLSIHRLVQAVQRDGMNPETQRHWAESAVRAVNAVFPQDPGEPAAWPRCLRYLDQAQACHALIEQYELSFVEAANILSRTGLYLDNHFLYALAEPIFQRALSIREQQLGPVHPSTAVSLTNLASLYKDQGRYSEAEPLYLRALSIKEQQVGPAEPSTATSLVNLASLYRAQARYSEAEPLYLRALSIDTHVYGEEHLEVASDLNGLAGLYWEQGRYSEAEPLYERALAIREQQLGAEHRSTAVSVTNLAKLYERQGRHSEAEPLYERALSIDTRIYGAERLEVASDLNYLAGLYRAQGRYSEAEPLYQRALAIKEQQVGPADLSTAAGLNNLAEIYRAQGRYSEAEPLYQRALAIYEQLLGASHPDTASSLNNLAILYYKHGKYAEAEPLYLRTLAIKEQQLGPVHPSVATGLNNLAKLYEGQGRYSEAEPLYQRALAIKEQWLGPVHPSTAAGINNLAGFYREQGRYAEAEPLYQRALAIYEQQLGPVHPETATSLNSLALLRQKQGRYEEAERLYQRVLSIRQEKLGDEHPDTGRSFDALAELYQTQGRYAEAEPLYKRALHIQEQRFGPEHALPQTVRKKYAALLRAMQRTEAAEKLEER